MKDQSKLFERWMTKQFGADVKKLFVRDGKGAYIDEMINGMYISFCAGMMLA